MKPAFFNHSLPDYAGSKGRKKGFNAVSILSILAFVFMAIGVASTASELSAKTAGFPITAEKSSLLQYTSNGHVLAFAPNNAYLAGLDHALTVEFVDGLGVSPVGTAGSDILNQSGKTPPLGKVTYKNIWNGIDIIYSSTSTGVVESTYVIRPGASVNAIHLQYNVPVQVMEDGALRFTFETGFIEESAPIAWQEIDGNHVPVMVRFFEKNGWVCLDVGEYDQNFMLTIDPTYVWHTFYGSGDDDGKAITIDESGNIYVTGTSTTSWNGPGSKAPLHKYTGNSDIVVVKLTSTGTYQWHTFYGSSSVDNGFAIVSDTNDNIYVIGTSRATWDGPGSKAPLNTYKGKDDIVTFKLSGAGAYEWHTFYGSLSNWDTGFSIARDDIGNIFVLGESGASWNGPANEVPLHSFTNMVDIVVIKLNDSGSYQWHTFYGASEWDRGSSIVADNSGSVYIAGFSSNSWNGPASEPPLNAYSGLADIVVFKLDSAGAYQWHTFLGSAIDDDYGNAINIDRNGNILIAGLSYASWNGPSSQPPLNGHSGGYNIVIIKLNSMGIYQWHTFYGSAVHNSGNAIASDEIGNIILAGYSYGNWRGPGNKSPLNAYAGDADIVMIKLSSTGAYQWHTFYGSNIMDLGEGIALDANGNIYVAGLSSAIWNGPGSKAPLNNSGGMVIIKMTDVIPIPVTINQLSSQLDPTTIANINFKIKFEKPIKVSTFSSSDITLSGTAIATTAIITEIFPNDGTTFKLTVRGMSKSGIVKPSIGAGKVTGLAGAPNATSTSTDNTVTYYQETDTLCANVPAILSGQDQFNSLVAKDDIDPYQLEVPAPYTTIVATLTPPSTGDFDLYLYGDCQDGPVDVAWGHIGRRYLHIGRRYLHIGPGDEQKIEVRFNVGKATGTYYLAVMVPEGGTYNGGQYQLKLQLQPPDFGLVDTLILYSPTRFKDKYGLEAASQMMDKLTLLANHPKVNGLIIQLDQFPNVKTAYDTWDNTPVIQNDENSYQANVTTANMVSNTIRAAMLETIQANQTLVTGYVVLVGDDDQIPFRRLIIVPDPIIGDPNWYSEKVYFQDLGDAVNTPIDAALMTDQTLSDDFYGDYFDHPWVGNLPSLSVGRLLDTPTRIHAAIDSFLNLNGEVDLTIPGSSGTVAGYDFLADSAQEACAYLQTNNSLPMDCSLINSSFTKSDLSQKLIINAPNISGYYGHSNHGQLFPAIGYPLTAEEISSSSFDPISSLWWAIGCQSGLVMPDSEVQPLSLIQALADHGVTYLGNTGWAYGGNGPLTHSELLYNLMIEQLGSNSSGSVAIGDALRLAKQEYFFRSITNTNGNKNNFLSYYDGKVMAEATLYGLPMLKFKLPYVAPPGGALEKQQIISELNTTHSSIPTQFHTVSISPHNLVSNLQQYNGNTYYTDNDGKYSFLAGAPVLPRSEYFNFDTSLGQAKGVIWLGGIYNFQTINPLIVQPVQLNGVLSVESTFNGVYPLLPVTLVSLSELKGTFSNHLTFQTGQFIGNEASGTLRLFTDMDFLVGLWNGTSTDNTGPTINGINMSTDGNALNIDLSMTDTSGIYAAYVTYTDGSGTWQSAELSGATACSPGTQTYTLTGLPLTTGITNYFIQVMDCAGNVSVKMNNGQYFNVSSDIPFVTSVTCSDPNPASTRSVDFTVNFSEGLNGVDTTAPFSDFALVTSGVSGASITAVAPLSYSEYKVTVNTGAGNGTIHLNVVDDGTIQDLNSNPLGGEGTGNGNFSLGETYTINKILTAYSTGANDGWTLESGELSNRGGTFNNLGTLRLGDDTTRNQYRSILSFDTSSLPDNAVITKITLNVKRQGVVGGGDPASLFQGFMLDVRRGIFGSSALLQAADWQATAHKTLGPFTTPVASGWYTLDLTTAKAYINKLASYSGVTQIRLRFNLDDNNNSVANYLSLYSGEAGSTARPGLIIEYYVP